MLRPVKLRIALLLLGLHMLVLGTVGPRPIGAFLSDSIQLVLGVLVLLCCRDAWRSSAPYGRYLWRVVATSFLIWTIGQALGVSVDVIQLKTGHLGPPVIQWYASIFFELWFLPLGLTLFVDPEQAAERFDWVVVLDILQTGAVLVAAFLFFFLIPFHTGAYNVDLANSVRNPYFLLHAAILTAFCIRSLSDPHPHTRTFFRWLTLFLCCSIAADLTFFYSSLHDLPTGSWFDLVWSSLLAIPVLGATRWMGVVEPNHVVAQNAPARRTFSNQFFPLLFPLLVLGLSANLSFTHRTAAFAVVLFSYGCLSVRLLVTHYRLLRFQQSLEHRASHDELTGMYNRAAILHTLQRELNRSLRTGSSVGIVMLDADKFKALNDEYGHLAGDKVLELLGHELLQTTRPYDAVGRYGGEEFLLVLPGCSLEESAAFARRVRERIEKATLAVNHETLHCTVSCGVACGSGDTSINEILRAADRALYAAKALGRNRVEIAPASEIDTKPQKAPESQKG